MTPLSKFLFCLSLVCITLFALVAGGPTNTPANKASNTAELDSLKAQLTKLQQELTASMNKEKELQGRFDETLKKLKESEHCESTLTAAKSKFDTVSKKAQDLETKLQEKGDDACRAFLERLYVWKAIALKQAEKLSTQAEHYTNHASELYQKNVQPHVGDALGVTAEYVDKTLGVTGEYVDQALGVTNEFVDQTLSSAKKFYDQNAPPQAKKIVNDYIPYYERVKRIYDQVHEKVSTYIWPFKPFHRFRHLAATLFLFTLPLTLLIIAFKWFRPSKKSRRSTTFTSSIDNSPPPTAQKVKSSGKPKNQ